MAATGTPTPNIGLRIPQGTDPASVDDINYNSNLLDTKLGAVGNTSVQDQIDSLNRNMAAKKLLGEISANSSSTLTLTANARGLIYISGRTYTSMALFGLHILGNGSVATADIYKGTDISVTTAGTNTITIANASANSVFAYLLNFNV